MRSKFTIGLIAAAVALACLILIFVMKKPAAPSTEAPKEKEGHGEHGEGEGEEHGEAVELSEDQIKAAGIQIETVQAGELNIEISLPGEIKLNADNLSHIVPRFGGAIKQIRKNLGDHVQKGETLAVIESNESLASYEIKALTDGTVIQKHATMGEVVPENTEVFVVANLQTVWLDLNVYPKDLPYVRDNQEVIVSGPVKDLIAKTRIVYVGPLVSESTRTAMARAVIPNKDGKWRPGMFVSAKVAVDKINVPVKVAKIAVQKVEGADSVFVQTEHGFLAKPVKIGRADSSSFEILEGLAAGESYVTQGAFILKAEKGKSEAEHDH